MTFAEKTKQNFNQVADSILKNLQAGEDANVNLNAEESIFIRFNGSKIRQNTSVQQQSIDLLLQKNKRTANISFSITGDTAEDLKRAEYWLNEARKECALLPEDPYQVPLANNGTSDKTFAGHLLTIAELMETIATEAAGTDLAGLYTAGPLITANRNSKGQSHWFATENFFMDYSLYMGEKAVKAVYAGTEWKTSEFKANLTQCKNQLSLMDRPKKTVPPGAYRTYLAPGAVAELSTMFQWGALSYSGFKQGQSALQKLADKERQFSPKFSLRENYNMGLTHQFNSLGELAPPTLDLIKDGQLQSFLVSTRSAKEYSAEGNAASTGESPRALEILPGTLKQADILKELGTGLYLSNLHYLNWSDRPTARITGMTRYACFWVENGEIVAPIADLRFDESLIDCLGDNLVAVTDFQEVDPQVSTYESRSFGGKKIPGMLINDFKFTL